MPQEHFESARSSPSQYAALFDWRPNLDRFEREVQQAELTRKRDELALAEMDCTVDLIDAELLALRAEPEPDDRLRREIDDWVRIRGRLLRLIRRMRLLAPAEA